jgi:hypothetical protein
MADTEKGICPDCGQEYALKKDGTVWKHDCEPENEPETMVATPPDVNLDDGDADDQAAESEDADEKPKPKRAGGHVDRGDGKGWVPDDESESQPEPESEPMHAPEPDPATVMREPTVAGGWTLPADPVPGKE